MVGVYREGPINGTCVAWTIERMDDDGLRTSLSRCVEPCRRNVASSKVVRILHTGESTDLLTAWITLTLHSSSLLSAMRRHALRRPYCEWQMDKRSTSNAT